jgi:hypothetical protein
MDTQGIQIFVNEATSFLYKRIDKKLPLLEEEKKKQIIRYFIACYITVKENKNLCWYLKVFCEHDSNCEHDIKKLAAIERANLEILMPFFYLIKQIGFLSRIKRGKTYLSKKDILFILHEFCCHQVVTQKKAKRLKDIAKLERMWSSS